MPVTNATYAEAVERINDLTVSRAKLIAALNDVKEWFREWSVPVGSAEEALFERIDKAIEASAFGWEVYGTRR